MQRYSDKFTHARLHATKMSEFCHFLDIYQFPPPQKPFFPQNRPTLVPRNRAHPGGQAVRQPVPPAPWQRARALPLPSQSIVCQHLAAQDTRLRPLAASWKWAPWRKPGRCAPSEDLDAAHEAQKRAHIHTHVLFTLKKVKKMLQFTSHSRRNKDLSVNLPL